MSLMKWLQTWYVKEPLGFFFLWNPIWVGAAGYIPKRPRRERNVFLTKKVFANAEKTKSAFITVLQYYFLQDMVV